MEQIQTNPDDQLSMYWIIRKYPRAFAQHFLPPYTMFVMGVEDIDEAKNEVLVTASIKLHHQSTKGSTQQFTVPFDKIQVWRKNVRLYGFLNGQRK